MDQITLLDWPSEALQRAFTLLDAMSHSNLCIVDVGAHHGELIPLLSEIISDGQSISYYGFEPDERNFHELQMTLDRYVSDKLLTRISPLAISSSCREGLFYQSKSDVVSGLLEPEEELNFRVTAGDHNTIRSVQIRTVTLDSELKPLLTNNSINLLKVDTEGHDYDVLVGASGLLDCQLFDVVICEFFPVKYRKNQAYMWDICNYLHRKGYYFDNFYDTRQTSQGRLYTGNLLFVSRRVSEAHSFL